jgi:hypothetical protein
VIRRQDEAADGFPTGQNTAVDSACHKAIPFQTSKHIGQELLRDSINRPPQLGKGHFPSMPIRTVQF